MTDTTTTPAPAPAAVEAPAMHSTVDSWVAERSAKRAAAEPVRDDGGKFQSRNPQPAPEETEDGEEAPDDTEFEPDAQSGEEVEGESYEANADDEHVDPPEPVTVIEAPQFWDAEGKEAFAKLSPAAKSEVARYEKQRSLAVAKAMQKSAETTRAAEAKLMQLRETSDRIGEYVDAGDERMQQWEDWFTSEGTNLAQNDPGAYVAEEARYKAEKREHEQLKANRADADRITFQSHREEQSRLLAEVAPELVDPKEGPKRMAETVSFLQELGFDNERIRWISATEASLAHKAMMWDRAQARAQQAPKPKPKPSGPNAAPAGQGQRASSSEAQLKALQGKQNLSQDEFLQLRRLQRK